jgi:nanoRNase/pAp phosphatase (c-di-AMP/oligoRNAs hydrolase)
MRRVLVCPTDFLSRLLQGTSGNPDSWLFLVSDAKTRNALARQEANALAGPLDDPGLYRRAHLAAGDVVMVMAPERPRSGPSLVRILETILDVAPDVPVLVVHQGARPPSLPALPNVNTVMLCRTMRDVLRPEMNRVLLRVRIEQMRHLLAGKDRVGILLQDDPDPDAMASGLALRSLLGRTRATAPLLSFGRVTRPENLAMVEALEIEVDQVTAEELRAYDALAMVDVQPAFCEEALPQVAVVIDHHPEAKGWRAPFRDVRPTYGATSTIMTEYLRAAEVKITERLATALFYGIKTDTLHLERSGTRADMEAFAYLYQFANHNILRRIERPELPLDALDALGDALVHRTIIHGALFAHLGRVSRPDLIPQFADLCLQVKGIEWSVVSGLTGDEVHISVRNVGYVRAAGDVVQAAFGELGSAGGHRSAAKAVIPASAWAAQVSPLDAPAMRRSIVNRFVHALDGTTATP